MTFELGSDVWDVTAAFAARPKAAAAAEATADLARLFDQHGPELVRCLVAAGCGDGVEIVEESFASAIVHWHRVNRSGEPLLWIRRVAIKHALSRSRSRRRHVAVPDRRQLAVSLYYYLELPVAEIATAMNETEDSVRLHLRAARAAAAHTLDCAR